MSFEVFLNYTKNSSLIVNVVAYIKWFLRSRFIWIFNKIKHAIRFWLEFLKT